MKDSVVLTATKMNEIRFLFVKKNNKIFELYQQAQKETNGNKSIFDPVISNHVISEFNKTIETMRINCTDLISKFLNNFVESEKNLQKDSYNTAKSRRFSKGIIELLENSFFANEYPSDPEKQAIANACKITTKQVNNWFTNKRNRAKNMRSGSKKIN